MTNKDLALSYLENGFSVIPLWSQEMIKRRPPKNFMGNVKNALAKNKDKSDPLPEEEILQKHLTSQCKMPIFSWKQFQTELPTKEQVNYWFTQDPDANIGIITGKVSGIVVFDLDSPAAEEYAEEMGGFPDTVKVKTGKGYHVYMKYPDFDIGNSVNKDLDIDIRADGGYVVAPGSIHGSGEMYDWEEGYSIDEIDPNMCTPWMMDYLEDVSKMNKKVSKKKPSVEKPVKTVEAVENKTEVKNDYLSILQNGSREGERNATATKLIGSLFKKGIEEGIILETIRMWNQQRNHPPLGDSELKGIFNSVKSMESKSPDKEIKIDAFIDKPINVDAEYGEGYMRVPFSNDGLGFLQKQLNGGFAGGRFYILGGIPSSGKTVLINNISDNICLNGQPVLFFSLDDSKSELRHRTFARFCDYSIEDFNQNKVPAKIIKEIYREKTVSQILDLKYIVQRGINVEKWTQLIEQIEKKHKKPPVIIVDYLRKLRTGKKTSDERLRVDDIISNLTDIAKKHNLPVVVISELARDSYKSGQRLSMASFKESGTIEYEASWLGILAAVEETKGGGYKMKENWEHIIEHDGTVDLIVFKAKRGTGLTGKIPLKIDKNKMTVIDRKDHPDVDTVNKTRKTSKFA